MQTYLYNKEVDCLFILYLKQRNTNTTHAKTLPGHYSEHAKKWLSPQSMFGFINENVLLLW